MKTITLKADDSFFEKVTQLAKALKLSKSELIRRSVAEYEETMKRRELKEQMRQASMRVRKSSAEISREFDNTIADGLDEL
ncbi:MAG TPA: ribbon-helix-helix protein, CopG family [Epsilonproteobacteria bacterium]|jgi:predicted transcriptional regulator|nr:ribbon-helix-helix protein, CopG family [Campylobacterota bacterium]